MAKSRFEIETADWLRGLADAGANSSAMPSLATQLRVLSAVVEPSAILCSGDAALPYVTWLRHGMSMQSRLIVHVARANTELENVLQSQVELDIRLATHVQDTREFCDDVSQHRFDLLISAHDEAADRNALLPLLGHNGMLVIIGGQGLDLSAYEADFFLSAIADDAVLMARKSEFHHPTRGRARRRQGRG